ncbi:MAG: IS66 family insertion sequence element accessory protein TnpB [Treponema sp.]|nr:IS66 family insertion sequence element accessory protein TnpB [Treponema sp.]
MKIDFENAKIYVRPGSTDLRKGVSGLTAIIENEMKLSALSESVFLFCNKSHKLLKVIFWNKTGFWIAQKRLERSTWPWPNTETAAREITNDQLSMLLCGIDFWRAHEEIKFSSVF